MNQKVLIPRQARFFPSLIDRIRCGEIVTQNPIERFDNIQDWFFFIHIDPVQRLIHSTGMFLSLPCFGFMIISLIDGHYAQGLIFCALASFFFYWVGVISHFIYDYAQAKSEVKNFMPTFGTIIRINLKTMLGGYDQELREFIKKYPFTTTEHDLIEVPKNQVMRFLFSSSDIDTTQDHALSGREFEF